jgi:hypothetical protein
VVPTGESEIRLPTNILRPDSAVFPAVARMIADGASLRADSADNAIRLIVAVLHTVEDLDSNTHSVHVFGLDNRLLGIFRLCG